MGRNRSRRSNRKKRSSPQSINQEVRSTSSSQVTGSPPRRRFHIDWTQINFWQFIILLFAPLLFSIVVIVPILSGLHHLRPETAIIAEPFVTLIIVVTGILAAGFIRIRMIDPFNPQKFKSKQAVITIIFGIFLSLALLGTAISPQTCPKSNLFSKYNMCCCSYPDFTLDGQNLTSLLHH